MQLILIKASQKLCEIWANCKGCRNTVCYDVKTLKIENSDPKRPTAKMQLQHNSFAHFFDQETSNNTSKGADT